MTRRPVLVLLLVSAAHGILEAWHYRAIRARNVEDCTRECDEDIKCRAWVYERYTKECRLNEYIEVARNEHLAIDQGITYVSGVKRGAKRLRVGRASYFVVCYCDSNHPALCALARPPACSTPR